MADVNRFIWWAFSFLCHQIPERSPHIFGVQFPLCWRCSGIAVGAAVLIMYLLKMRRMPGLGLSLALALFLPLDVFATMAGFWTGDNSVRFVTGGLWGFFGIAAVLGLFVLLRRRTKDCYSVRRLAAEGPSAAAPQAGKF